MPHDAYISFASKDQDTAYMVCSALEAQGVVCWFAPRDADPDQPFGPQAFGAIRSAKVLVLVLTGDSNRSTRVSEELERAISRGLPVVTFQVDSVELSKTMQYFLGDDVAAAGDGAGGTKDLGSLVREVREALGRSPVYVEGEEAESVSAPADKIEAAVPEGGLKAVVRRVGVTNLVLAVVGLIAVAAAIMVMSGRGPAPAPDQSGSEVAVGTLSVQPDPPEARVRILNVVKKYQPGMELPPGRYKVEVSFPEYDKKVEWIEIEAGKNHTIPIALEKLPPTDGTLTINTTPPAAQVRVLNISPKYQAGMMLRAGRYKVEVSCPGYKTRTEWVEVTAGQETVAEFQLEPVED